MSWAKPARKIFVQSFAILILSAAPFVASAQQHHEGGSAPPPAHSSAPPTNTNHGSPNTNVGGAGRSGGSTGGSNPYGAAGNGNSHGSTGASNNSGGSSNPYGAYGNRTPSNSATGGAGGTNSSHGSSNPYGAYGNRAPSGSTAGGAGTGGGATGTAHGSSNPYGAYGNRTPSNSATGGAGGAAGANGNRGTNNTYGAYGNRGATNNAGGAGGVNGNRGASNTHTTGAGGTNSTHGVGSNAMVGRGGNTGGSNALSHGGNNAMTGHGPNNAMAAHGSGPPPGGHSVTRSNGDRVDYNRAGSRTGIVTHSGAAARFDSHGRVSTIHAHDMTINHSGRGRTIITERADHSRLVSMGRGRGYAEHPYRRGGHEYMRRTYYVNGRAYARAYRGYYYHGYRYYRYAPAYYYSPGFYGWAYNPWARPVVYGWGWGGAPWYGYYGYYFSPYPAYPSAAFWLTDYLIAQNLQAAYEAGQASAQLGDGRFVLAADKPVTMTPEVKKAVADEVAAIIAAEKNSAANSNAAPSGDVAPDALDPAHRTFVVATALSKETSDGTSCSLSPGDVLTRIDDTADADQNVKVKIAASQKDDCAVGSELAIGVQDLQDMHNHLREQVDDGLSALSKNQGKGGLPSGPAGNPQANADGQVEPDQNVGSDLQQQQHAADETESDVRQSAGASEGPST